MVIDPKHNQVTCRRTSLALQGHPAASVAIDYKNHCTQMTSLLLCCAEWTNSMRYLFLSDRVPFCIDIFPQWLTSIASTVCHLECQSMNGSRTALQNFGLNRAILHVVSRKLRQHIASEYIGCTFMGSLRFVRCTVFLVFAQSDVALTFIGGCRVPAMYSHISQEYRYLQSGNLPFV